MKLIKASTPYQGLQGECLTDTTTWGTNQRSILAFAKQTDHSCWALQERLPKDGTNHLLTWRHKDRWSGEAQCTVCRHISTAEPGRGGWELRCCICVRRRETVTQEPSTQMLTTRASGSRVQVQTLHTPARATPSGHAETQAESLSPSESRPPQGRGLSSTSGRDSEDKMFQRDFASLLIPLYPASRLRNKNSLHPYNPAISSCTV